MAKKEQKVNPSGKRRERGGQAVFDFVDERRAHIQSYICLINGPINLCASKRLRRILNALQYKTSITVRFHVCRHITTCL